MTISSTIRKAGPFPGNGVTVALPFTFKVFTAADVLAVKATTATGAETTLALGADYTVSLNADQDTAPGGTLTLVTAHATGTTVTLTTQVENTQETDLTNLGGFYPKVITSALDRATIQIQQLAEKLSRVLTFGISSGASGALPNPTPLGLLGWNAAGTALQNYVGAAGAAVSAFMANVVAAADAAAAQTALGASAVGRAVFGATNAAAARLGIGAAASGANNDITSLTALAAGGLPDNSVLTADIANLAVSTAKLADGSVTPAKLAQPFTLGTAQPTTSGTAVDFTGIPSWVKRITIAFNEVSFGGAASGMRIQIGDGAINTTGYLASSSRITDAAASSVARDSGGFPIRIIDLTSNLVGCATITNMGGNRWIFSFSGGDSGADRGYFSGGMKLLAGTLDRLRITSTNGTDPFDAGSVNVLYEG